MLPKILDLIRSLLHHVVLLMRLFNLTKLIQYSLTYLGFYNSITFRGISDPESSGTIEDVEKDKSPLNLGSTSPLILKQISDYLGADNALPFLNRYTYEVLHKIYPWKQMVHVHTGISELVESEMSTVGNELNRILRSVESLNESELINFLLRDLCNCEYASSAVPLYKYLLRKFKQDKSYFVSSWQIFVGNFTIKYLDIEHLWMFYELNPAALIILYHFTVWDPVRLSNFFRKLVQFSRADEIIQKLIEVEGIKILPYLIAYKVPDSHWRAYLNASNPSMIIDIFYAFFVREPYPIEREALNHFINIFRELNVDFINDTKAFLVNNYLSLATDSLSESEVVSLVKTSELDQKFELDFCCMALNLGKLEIIKAFESRGDGFFVNITGNIMKNWIDFAGSDVSSDENFNLIMISYVLKVYFDLEGIIHKEMKVLLNMYVCMYYIFYLYEVESMEIEDGIKLNLSLSRERAEKSPFCVSFPEKKSVDLLFDNVFIFPLLLSINTENVEVLEKLLGFMDYADYARISRGAPISISFLKAAQKSENFSQKLSQWKTGEEKWNLSIAKVQSLMTLPATSIKKYFNYDLNLIKDLHDPEEAKNAMNLLGKSYVEIYEKIDFEGEEIYQIYHYYRAFFLSWMKSSESINLDRIDNEEILRLLAIDSPKQCDRIRKLKHLRSRKSSFFHHLFDLQEEFD